MTVLSLFSGWLFTPSSVYNSGIMKIRRQTKLKEYQREGFFFGRILIPRQYYSQQSGSFPHSDHCEGSVSHCTVLHKSSEDIC